jgi:general secretion pathway protein E
MAMTETAPLSTVTPEPASAPANAGPLLSFAYARRHGILLVLDGQGTTQGYFRPSAQAPAIAEAQRRASGPISWTSETEEAFEARLSGAFEREGSAARQMVEDLGDAFDLAALAEEVRETEDLLAQENEAPIIRLLNAILSEAIREDASDIHLETFDHILAVRFRIDGVLREIVRPKRALAPLLVSRLKVMAKLDIAEKRVPQDGRISLRVAGREVDVRVSTLPTASGERVVLRLLDKQAGRLELEKLGMAPDTLAALKGVVRRPHGIVLVTGPTGSGKTTTLYAALSTLDTQSANVMTVEDPIEYHLPGIGQTQVNSKAQMTFARGLRAILRQDPDVVMVGEIRDLETAEIAIQAALTGHLVLSTLHTNSALGAIARLRDLGVESYLLSSSLSAVLAQRLVRRLCEHCKVAAPADARTRALLGLGNDAPMLFDAVGCDACAGTGYRGRTGIYELVNIDSGLSQLIHDDAPAQALAEAHHGHKLFEDGKRKILAGETTLTEVLRVTRDEG